MHHHMDIGKDIFGSARHLRHPIAALAFAALFTGCSMPIKASSNSVEFVCSVEGSGLLKPVISDAAICAAFKQKVDEALPHPSEAVDKSSGSNWIKLDIRFSKPGIATAMISRDQGNGAKPLDPVAVSVMDKPLGQNEINMLAKEVAKQISNKGVS